MEISLGKFYLQQLESEVKASRQCLERLNDEVLAFKPTEEAMPLKSLAITVAEIPKWIHSIVTEGGIDFATYGRYKLESAKDLPAHFDECMAMAREALGAVKDEELEKDFSLKMNGQVLSTDSKKNSVDSTIRHLVHHRGQLTVYMRMNKLTIPQIYGPSGDEKNW